MNYQEEQESELQALGEIYYNEIKVMSDKPPITFAIKIRPQASNFCDDALDQRANNSDDDDDDGPDDDDDYDDDDSGDEEYGDNDQQSSSEAFVKMQFTLPPKYPDEKPSVQMLESSGLTKNNLEQLMSMVDSKAEESLGMVMVFTLVSEVVEWLMTRSEQETQEIEEQQSADRSKTAEAKRFEGTPVTMQTFLAWKAKFDAEILKEKLEKQAQLELGTIGPRRLTGREMFESDKTLAESDLNFVEDLDQNQLEALLQNIDEVDLNKDDLEIDLDPNDFVGKGDDDKSDDEKESDIDVTNNEDATPSKR